MSSSSTHKRSSTATREARGLRIEATGSIMVKPCSRCKKNKFVCRVLPSSGKCGRCTLSNCKSCDVEVTETEWLRLKTQRVALQKEMDDARKESLYIMEELLRLQDQSSKALAKEARLRKQMDLLEHREIGAMAAEEANIKQLEVEESLSVPVSGPNPDLHMSPLSWSAVSGIPDDFWSSEFDWSVVPSLNQETSVQ